MWIPWEHVSHIERTCAVIRTFAPVPKTGGWRVMGLGPNALLDRQSVPGCSPGLLGTMLRDGTSGCWVPVPLMCCDDGSGSIPARA